MPKPDSENRPRTKNESDRKKWLPRAAALFVIGALFLIGCQLEGSPTRDATEPTNGSTPKPIATLVDNQPSAITPFPTKETKTITTIDPIDQAMPAWFADKIRQSIFELEATTSDGIIEHCTTQAISPAKFVTTDHCPKDETSARSPINIVFPGGTRKTVDLVRNGVAGIDIPLLTSLDAATIKHSTIVTRAITIDDLTDRVFATWSPVQYTGDKRDQTLSPPYYLKTIGPIMINNQFMVAVLTNIDRRSNGVNFLRSGNSGGCIVSVQTEETKDPLSCIGVYWGSAADDDLQVIYNVLRVKGPPDARVGVIQPFRVAIPGYEGK